MNKIVKITLVTALVIFSLVSLSGCNDEFGEPIDLIIIYQDTACSYKYTDQHFDRIEPYIDRAVYGGTVTLIRADGEPKQMEILSNDGMPVKFETDANNSRIKRKRINSYKNIVIDFLKSDQAMAIQPEIDLLSAIKECDKLLENSTSAEKHVIIMSPLVSTKGRINFTSFDISDFNREAFFASLSEHQGILPTGLNNASSIKFIAVGDTAPPQMMPDVILPKVKGFWEELLVTCGVEREKISFISAPSGSVPNIYTEDEGGYPFVSTVLFTDVEILPESSKNEIDINSGSGDTQADTSHSNEIDFVSNNNSGLLLPDVGFVPDSDRMLSEENAMSILEPYAIAMIKFFEENPNEYLYLVGTTAVAKQGGAGNIELSIRRSNKLKELLELLDVPPDKLIALGIGGNDPYRVDEWVNGSFDTVLAQANRTVKVFDFSNQAFQEILIHNNINLSNISG